MKDIITARPPWLKKRLVLNSAYARTRIAVSEGGIHTVCASSLCPNQNECFSRAQATFLLLGDVCTRACAFCSVKKGRPFSCEDETEKVFDAIAKLGIRYAVLTSVTRDDLEDGGARQFADVVRLVKSDPRNIRVEVLTPDFKGDKQAIKTVADSAPDVFGHNIETVESLYSHVRPGAVYSRSLELLRYVKELNPRQLAKSSIMVGLGEKDEDLFAAIRDLREAGCDILTIGQYLRPGPENIAVTKYVLPEDFDRYRVMALSLGFKYVASGPFVRSSYMAEDAYHACKGGDDDRS